MVKVSIHLLNGLNFAYLGALKLIYAPAVTKTLFYALLLIISEVSWKMEYYILSCFVHTCLF